MATQANPQEQTESEFPQMVRTILAEFLLDPVRAHEASDPQVLTALEAIVTELHGFRQAKDVAERAGYCYPRTAYEAQEMIRRTGNKSVL